MKYRIFGISVEISYYFLCAACLSLAFDKSGMITVAMLSALLHEVGHLFFIVIFKGQVRSLRLALGCLGIEYSDTFTKSEEIICLLAGPFLNLIVGLVGRLLGYTTFSVINLVFGVYNLLPVHGLDGGSILAKMLEGRMEEGKISLLTDLLTLFVALLLLILFFVGIGFDSVNISLILLVLYLLLPVISKNLLKDRKN